MSILTNCDLNLLVSLQALIEERSLTRAGRRLSLTQPAVSRIFDRLQLMFGDELLVRIKREYEPTRRALEIYAELQCLLPRVEHLLQPHTFEPAAAAGVFRIAATDYSAMVVLPGLTKILAKASPGLRLEVSPLDNTNVLEKLSANTLDLAFRVTESPQPFRWEPLFEDRLVCLVRRGHPLCHGRMTLDVYLKQKHVAGGGMPGLVQRNWDALGVKPDIQLRVPFSVLGLIIERTDSLATVPQRMAKRLAAMSRTQIVPAPREFERFTYLQVWHPRNEFDQVHMWMRELVKKVST